jgi:hypothetical protein
MGQNGSGTCSRTGNETMDSTVGFVAICVLATALVLGLALWWPRDDGE